MGFLHTFHIWNHVGFLNILDFGEFQYLFLPLCQQMKQVNLCKQLKAQGVPQERRKQEDNERLLPFF